MNRKPLTSKRGFKVGDLVTANGGYPGRVTRIVEWSPSRSLIEVRLASGEVCIDDSDAQPVQPNTIDHLCRRCGRRMDHAHADTQGLCDLCDGEDNPPHPMPMI